MVVEEDVVVVAPSEGGLAWVAVVVVVAGRRRRRCVAVGRSSVAEAPLAGLVLQVLLHLVEILRKNRYKAFISREKQRAR